MNKLINKRSISILLMISGLFLVLSGLVLKANATQIYEQRSYLDPTQLVPPGQRLDLVQNLYYRTIRWDADDEIWVPTEGEQMHKLGRFFGGYIVGYTICNQFNYDSVNKSYTCQGDQQQSPTGFGMLYQINQNSMAIAIPLTGSFCNGECTPPAGQDGVYPWFSYPLSNWTSSGHEYGTGHPVGYEQAENPGYVSLEVRTDLKDLPPYENE